MSQQSGLFDSAPPEPTDRLFFALFPDAATAERIRTLAQDFCRRNGLAGKLLEPERLHITLFHVGDWAGLPADTVQAAQAAAAKLRAAPFELSLDQVMSFSPHRPRPPLVLRAGGGNAALHAMRAALGRELAKAGLGRCVTPSFEPHVTLSYPPQGAATEAVQPVSWKAEEFLLVHSLLGKTVHIPLNRWPLQA